MTKYFTRAVRLRRVVAIHRGKGAGSAITWIKVQKRNGHDEEWETEKAIEAMVDGTHAFFVIGEIAPGTADPLGTHPQTGRPLSRGLMWSPVTPWSYEDATAMKTVKDKNLPSDLGSLPPFTPKKAKVTPKMAKVTPKMAKVP